MRELRHILFPSEKAIKQNMQWRRREPFLTPYHMTDFHKVIIHHIGEMISWHSIRLQQYLVVNLGRMNIHPSADKIVKPYLFLARDFQADNVRRTRSNQILNLVGIER